MFVSDSKQGVSPLSLNSVKLLLTKYSEALMDEENTLLWKQQIQNCLESNLPVRTWCNQNHISPPTFYYWKKKLSKDISSVEEITPVFTEVNSGVATEELQQPTSLQISWNQMHFNIATKKEAHHEVKMSSQNSCY